MKKWREDETLTTTTLFRDGQLTFAIRAKLLFVAINGNRYRRWRFRRRRPPPPAPDNYAGNVARRFRNSRKRERNRNERKLENRRVNRRGRIFRRFAVSVLRPELLESLCLEYYALEIAEKEWMRPEIRSVRRCWSESKRKQVYILDFAMTRFILRNRQELRYI